MKILLTLFVLLFSSSVVAEIFVLPSPPLKIEEGTSDAGGLKGKGIYCQDKDLIID